MSDYFFFIPARAGSKGVPGKNWKKLFGKPLIEYTIDSLENLNFKKQVVVSSDSQEVNDICKNKGIKFSNRPFHLATDNSKIFDVLVSYYQDINIKDDDVIFLLQPTSPFRQDIDIEKCIHIFESDFSIDTVVSFVEVGDKHPGRMYRISNSEAQPLNPSLVHAARQELDPVFLRNGAIYAFKYKNLKKGSIYGNKIFPYIMPENRSINIDTNTDWLLAELLIKNEKKINAN